MCDLWKNTLSETLAPGWIPMQIDAALAGLRAVDPSPLSQVKLYNSGSFFDPKAIPPEDYSAIAGRVGSFERVIVECHPALVGRRAVTFRDQVKTQLEVAMGLETVHPQVLPRLNKRMNLKQFAAAASFLRAEGIALRVFILIKPPFLEEEEAADWAERSVVFALECGATAAVLIPTRFGNGAVEELARQQAFAPPTRATVETAFERSLLLSGSRARVFVDLWDLDKFSGCSHCFSARRARLDRMNLAQEIEPSVECPVCRCRRMERSPASV
jgi:radical SAM enzyme (TIGR01210 family)